MTDARPWSIADLVSFPGLKLRLVDYLLWSFLFVLINPMYDNRLLRLKKKHTQIFDHRNLPLWPSITARWRGVFPEKRSTLGQVQINVHINNPTHVMKYICFVMYFNNKSSQAIAESLPCTSFWEMLWVLMREESRRTSPLNTHSWTGNSKSSLVRIIGFLLLSLTMVPIDDGLPLMLFALSCCCCCSTEVLAVFWNTLLDLKWLPVPLGIVPFEVSSYVSMISSFLFVLLWSFRMVRIFSPVMMTAVRWQVNYELDYRLENKSGS